MGMSAMGLKLESSGFCRLHTQKQTQNQRVYLHAQNTVDAGDISTRQTTVILITEKNFQDSRFEPNAVPE